ncbi:nucleotidyltransferase family protein [Pelomonas sp. SE-A7]|uniref:nucleotidyltransferase family protein n=1 Tax=Pelomonas sp. SE-A7 TaxID=3054953 RepID=UPI00259D0BD1|nr:nucleotidyltransferase family protein [Pelomonas sp. SE-A7]MDM4765398.1 nucleotidyltransferase family protein [Pelomonas sp. SE-A7]
MGSDDTQLPDVRQLEQVLRSTTLRLASELAAPQDEAPDWDGFEWRVALAVVAIHGIGALLANRLRWQGPPLWSAFLAEQRHHGQLRQVRIEDLLARIDHEARARGLGLQRLKGAALLELGLYAAGERPMGDIDLLLNAADMEAASALMRELGYRDDFDGSRHRSFAPGTLAAGLGFGEHEANPLRIELHDHVSERLPMQETDLSELIRAPVLEPGLNPYPDPLSLMRHLLLHAAGNIRTRSLRLVQLHDLALLAPRLSPGDWAALVTGPQAPGAWWAMPPLSLLERHFPGRLPRDLLKMLAADCPPLLRLSVQRLDIFEASLSCPRIAAFPGLAWSRTPGEALGLMLARLRPDRETRAQMRHSVATQPALANAGWTDRSQLRKLLRWTLSRPLRVPTLYSLRCALAYEPS